MNDHDIIERGFACLYENLGFIDTERFIAYVLTDEGYAEFMRRLERVRGVDSVNETDSVESMESGQSNIETK